MKGWVALVTSITILSGCMTANYSNKAVHPKNKNGLLQDLLVTGKLNPQMYTPHFGHLMFSFRNTSDDWIRIKSIDVSFNHPEIESKSKITSGQDLLGYKKRRK